MPHPAYLQHLAQLKTALQQNDRKAALAAARGLEQVAKQYRSLLEQANDAILLIDPDSGKLLDWNPRAEEITGYDSDQLRTLMLTDLYPDEDSTWLWSEFQKNLLEGRAVTPEVPLVRADGRRIYVDSSSSLVELGDRAVIQAILRDVTERVELALEAEKYARELERKNQQLARAQQLNSELLAKVSHELRTPLQAVVGYTSSLLEGIYGPIDEIQRGKLEIVDRNATHLNTLINQMLELSRLEAGLVAPLSEDVDVVPLLEEVFTRYREQLAARNLAGHFRSCAKRIICRTDPVRFREIVRELLTNAMKFTVRGEVCLKLEVDRWDLVVSVEDTGVGIPPEHLQYVFDIFRTSDDPFARRYSGPGLGLALVKKLTDLLGGRVEVETARDEGTKFTVYLPQVVRAVEGTAVRDKEPVVTAPRPPVSPDGPAGPVPDALVVDDDPYTVEFLSEFLERAAGCRVRKAYSGADAQLHLTERRPDFLFVDLLLPHTSGERILQYCEQLWGPGAVTMIVVTAKELTDKEINQLRKRAAAVIQKGNLRTEVLVDLLSPVVPLRQGTADTVPT